MVCLPAALLPLNSFENVRTAKTLTNPNISDYHTGAWLSAKSFQNDGWRMTIQRCPCLKRATNESNPMPNFRTPRLASLLASLMMVVSGAAHALPDRIVIIRHAEKPPQGNNLSCKGQNRALQLADVLFDKVGLPEHTYVPALKQGDATKHARMLQTVTPFAIKYNLTINSTFDESEVKKAAADVLQRSKTVLMVWEHSKIQALAQRLGATDAPPWDGHDFDSIWVITFAAGKAVLDTSGKEGLTPADQCSF
jgi:hypothetical protein